MIFDKQTLMSDQQAITATAGSMNQIDLTPRGSSLYSMVRDIGPGRPIPIAVQVTENFNNLTSLQVSLETDEDVAFGSPQVVRQTQAIPLASLVAGYKFLIDWVPRGTNERYMRIKYTVVGTAPTAGKVTAGITLAEAQTNG